MHKLRLFNTLTRQLEPFEPLDSERVRLYACGPTVYNFAHIGNLRTYVFVDVLRRALEANRYRVYHIMNITDVGHLTDDADEGEDKMEQTARRQRMSAQLLARSYTEAFLADLRALNIRLPHVLPKASEHIQQQIRLIQILEHKGYAYRTSDGLYFDTSRFPRYGALAKLETQQLRPGARVAVNPEKRQPQDFALWKFTPDGTTRQMEWTSPWGKGFPGWHIECSAMAMEYLGETFDLHTGGVDHIPVHHTNEIAQAEAATGRPFVRYWLHGAFLRLETSRMGKSEGNFVTLPSLVAQGYAPLAFRYLLLLTHYRKPLTFSTAALTAAQNAFHALQDRVRQMPPPRVGCAAFEEQFMDAVNDDLNMPKAVAVLWDMLKSDYPDHAKHQSLLQFDRVLGLKLNAVPTIDVPDDIARLVAEREEARRSNDFMKADALRDTIEQKGFSVEDTERGPVVKRGG